MTTEFLTVEAASEALQLHAKTVLRFIREGKLRATKVGKQYRVLRSDLDAFAGAPARIVPSRARATCVVDIEDVDQELLRRVSSTLAGARRDPETQGEALSVDIAHDPIRRTIKVIAIGAPGDLAMVLKLVDACLES
nr:helix-turn-helix domain-containing protein [uncultured Devosia sp.]